MTGIQYLYGSALSYILTGSSELKRKLEETFVPEDVKRKRIEGDVPSDLVTNIVATITEPEQMVGPDVRPK